MARHFIFVYTSNSDAVTRPVLVEPEGFEREIINASFLCSTGDGEYPYTRTNQ